MTDSWPPGSSQMAQKVRAFDWAATPLGPVACWPTELKTAAAFVLESRFPAALVWGTGLVTIYNDGFRPILGDKPEALGRSFADIWSEVWDSIGPLVAGAFAGESTFIEDYPLVVRRSDQPEQAWFTFCYSPVRAADGTVLGMIDTVVETTSDVRARQERKRSEEALRASEQHSRTLLAELQHRVRNTLAVVRSIARRTAERSDTVEEMIAHLEGRLDAFSRVQAVVTRSADGGVDLKSIIEDELLAVAARDGDQVQIQGEDILLVPRAAESISLAIHELATNAIKYGALSTRDGCIRVAWRRLCANGLERLQLEWTESGLNDMPPPEREGFGLELLRRTLPYDLGAETQIQFPPDGVRFSMSMPLGAAALAE